MTQEVAEILLLKRTLTDLEIDILRARLVRLEQKNRCINFAAPMASYELAGIKQEAYLINEALRLYRPKVQERNHLHALQKAGFRLLKGGVS